MPLRRSFWAWFFLLAAFAYSGAANAAGTVQLELVGDTRGAAMSFQQWAQLLGKAGVRNVRIRAAEAADRVGIETRGSDDSPVYVVTGIVQSRDELVLPGGRYRQGDVNRLVAWLDDLAKNGPVEQREKKVAFGLTPGEYDRALAELSAPLGFSTEDTTLRKIAGRIAEGLVPRLRIDAKVIEAMGEEKAGGQWIDLSRGTVLAYVLQTAGYGFMPHPGGEYSVVALQPGVETWPIGRATTGSVQETLPGLFEFLNVNVQNVSAATAIDAIAQRVKAPVLLDRAALRRHEIDPAKVMVTLPRSRTTYSLALRKLLFQARLKFEVRLDDAGKPFLWITSIKPS